MINSGGSAQRHYCVYEGVGFIQESWRWLADAVSASNLHSEAADQIRSWQHCDDVTGALAATLPVFADLPKLSATVLDEFKVARQSHRASGRTAINAREHVAEMPPPEDIDAPLSFTMEGVHNPAATTLQAVIRAPGWSSNQSIHKFLLGLNGQRIGRGPAVLLQRTTAALPHWQSVELHASRTLLVDKAKTTPLLAVPLYRLLGSGELSNSAAGIASVLTPAFAKLHPAEAATRGISHGDLLQLSLNGHLLQLTAQVDFEISPGVIGLPCGFPKHGDVGALLPAEVEIRKVTASSQQTEGDEA